jgi:predicted glycoside hydrolase/deacetylase ChbG (UPF0249 family)
MLIINADDLGRNYAATDNTLICYKQALITCASAMVFMADSQRAANLAATVGLETGLHLNLSEPFDAPLLPARLQEYHLPVVKYFRSRQWATLLYNPFIKKHVDYVFKAQYNEYCRLFGAEPLKLDGHHHMHLSMNVIMDHLIPSGVRVRRNFSFAPRERDIFNRTYRRIIDAWLVRRHICTDAFFSLRPSHEAKRLNEIIRLAFLSNIELMTHPEDRLEYDFLLSAQYYALIEGVPRGTYLMISRRSRKKGRERKTLNG